MTNKKIVNILIRYMITQLEENPLSACYSHICINLLSTEIIEDDFWKNFIEIKIKKIEKNLIKTIQELREDPFKEIAQLIRVNLSIESQEKNLKQNDKFFLAADNLFTFGQLALSSKKNNNALIFFYIASELKNHTDLKLLNAQYEIFNNLGYDNIAAKILYFLKKLRTLHLGAEHFLTQLKEIKSNFSQHIIDLDLSHLKLSYIKPEDSQKFKSELFEILQVMQKIPSIKLLNLSSNKIGHMGVELLSEMSKNDSIIEINLSHNRIICTKDRLKEFEQNFKKNYPKLQTVALNFNLLGQACKDYLKELNSKEEKDLNQIKKSHPTRLGIFTTQALGKTKSFLEPSREIDSDHWIAVLTCPKKTIPGHSALCIEGIDELGQRIFEMFDIYAFKGGKYATVRITREERLIQIDPEEYDRRIFPADKEKGNALIDLLRKEENKPVPFNKYLPAIGLENTKDNCTSWCLRKLEEAKILEKEEKPLAIPFLASKDPAKLCRIF